MKSPGLGVVGTLLASFFIFTNSATATNIVNFSDIRGTLSGTTAGLNLSGSTLFAVIGLIGGGVIAGDLGSLSSNTTSLASGSLGIDSIINPSRFFAINRSGLKGLNDVLFAGTFSGPVTLTLITLANRTQNYSVTGVYVGSIAGKVVDAAAVRSTVNTGKGFFQKSTLIEEEEITFAGANGTSVSSIPEPSTFTMLLTGVGTLGMVRYKLFTRRKRNKRDD